MTTRRETAIAFICSFGFLCAAMTIAGCKKSGAGGSGDAVEVVLSVPEMKPDGTINPQGIQKLEAQATAPALSVIFARTRVSDAGLNQLSQFRNLRRVQAVGSDLSPEAIDKLKAAVPEVIVIK